jgi:hypothetical protein
MACPVCACDRFYVKGQEDEYDMQEFDLRYGEVFIAAEETENGKIEIQDETEVFCDNCSWHGKLKELRKP